MAGFTFPNYGMNNQILYFEQYKCLKRTTIIYKNKSFLTILQFQILICWNDAPIWNAVQHEKFRGLKDHELPLICIFAVSRYSEQIQFIYDQGDVVKGMTGWFRLVTLWSFTILGYRDGELGDNYIWWCTLCYQSLSMKIDVAWLYWQQEYFNFQWVGKIWGRTHDEWYFNCSCAAFTTLFIILQAKTNRDNHSKSQRIRHTLTTH